MKIIQITSAGCNRECFALTDDGRVFLLIYYANETYKWKEVPNLLSNRKELKNAH